MRSRKSIRIAISTVVVATGMGFGVLTAPSARADARCGDQSHAHIHWGSNHYDHDEPLDNYWTSYGTTQYHFYHHMRREHGSQDQGYVGCTA